MNMKVRPPISIPEELMRRVGSSNSISKLFSLQMPARMGSFNWTRLGTGASSVVFSAQFMR